MSNSFLQANPFSLEAARFILEIVFERVFKRIDEDEKIMAAVRKEANELENRVKKIDVRKNFFVLATAVKGYHFIILRL